MLFNSHAFIFAFMPVTFWLFFVLGRRHRGVAAAWLAVASLFFYGWWNPLYVFLLLASISFNYTLGRWISQSSESTALRLRQLLLAFAVSTNLLVLAYYKYFNFFLSSVGHVTGQELSFGEIVLPLGISFFTFTQIAFLVDTYQGKAKEYNFVHYALFVTYFPHLIAGPVLHHKEMMPQFAVASTYRVDYENIAVGLTIFSIGLFKKVMLADGIAVYVAPVFNRAEEGTILTFMEAWGGALAFTLQLYFDFSGYSDMAIGLSRLFGIKLPLNFDSPYKAANIIDFWRRWHMTLSRFLRNYLYFPLGGNRAGSTRRYVNLMITMILGGLWHGAGWTFVVWGGLHGTYLVVNHGWQHLRKHLGFASVKPRWLSTTSATGLTFLAVVVGWVFFRARDLSSALSLLKSMVGMNGIVLPQAWQSLLDWGPASLAMKAGIRFGDSGVFQGKTEVAWILALLAIIWFLPNTQQIMARFNPGLGLVHAQAGQIGARLLWRPNWIWAIAVSLICGLSILNITRVSEFLYFQF